MSRFLGPIHHWLFNKITLHENLERELVDRFKSEYGDEIDEIVKDNRDKYGDPLPEKPLEEIIDTDNIHGWLQGKIEIVETRQASILGDLFKKYGTNGVLLSTSVYEDHGSKCGKDASNNYDVSSAEGIYKVLNNYILDGMPCDNANNVTEVEDDYLEYKQVQCLHIRYWKEAGVDPEKMYDLRRVWTESFVNEANPEFKYQVSIEDIDGQQGFKHKIFKK
ncbi:hypothetical protein [Sporosalibacterium faouarense]|uniref:hypothetical protein n=1 Tax=Sporosalibacterium faouarense TaxID=516123 RepID=UPI00141C5256|nr:hypothetical protein [Sporosalibacterium faouarense]MTI48844.1 hypothetical protein [Bacillota bacterium]